MRDSVFRPKGFMKGKPLNENDCLVRVRWLNSTHFHYMTMTGKVKNGNQIS